MSSDPLQSEFETRAHRQRKYREAAALLPILGAFVLVTPIISAFTTGADGSTLPRAIIYIFGVWAVLIFLATLLARRLKPDDGVR